MNYNEIIHLQDMYSRPSRALRAGDGARVHSEPRLQIEAAAGHASQDSGAGSTSILEAALALVQHPQHAVAQIELHDRARRVEREERCGRQKTRLRDHETESGADDARQNALAVHLPVTMGGSKMSMHACNEYIEKLVTSPRACRAARPRAERRPNNFTTEHD